MIRHAGALLLAIGLSSPLLIADDRYHDRDRDGRYYDRSHRDYHEWNANEERNFGIFLGERHIRVHVWEKAPSREQQRYWKWRHEHPDHQ